jgi:hypothetical protein
MSDWHSIWLQPAAADLERLQATVNRLADQLGTPRFMPHLTLVEDMQRTAEDLAGVFDGNFAREIAVSAPVTIIHGLPQFFRSLYVGFEPAGRLKHLKIRAVEAFGTGSVICVMPSFQRLSSFSERAIGSNPFKAFHASDGTSRFYQCRG